MPGKGKPFKTGNKAAVGKGRPPTPPDLKEARKLTRTQLETILNKYLHLNEAELKQALESPETSYLEKMIGNVMSMAADKGDHQRLDFLLTQLLGKLPEQTNNTTFNFMYLSREEVIKRGEQALLYLKNNAKEP